MAVLRLFAAARTAAGAARDVLPGETVAAVLDAAVARYGDEFAAVLPTCAVWVNGEPADPATPVGDADEVGVGALVERGAAR